MDDLFEKEIKDKIKGSDKFIKILRNESKGSTIYLLGTNHISNKSSEHTEQLLNIVKPDTVYLELSQDRVQYLTISDEIIKLAHKHTPRINWFTGDLSSFFLTVASTFYHYSTRITNYTSGNEMRVGYNYAKKNKSKVILGDRDQNQSWTRALNSIDIITLLKLYKDIFNLTDSVVKSSSKDIYDLLEKYVQEVDDSLDLDLQLLSQYPTLYKILINERDRYMASTLRDSPGKSIVAVVGRAHMPGISKHLNDQIEGFKVRAELEETTEPSFIFKYGLPLSIATGLAIPASLTMGSIYGIRRAIFKKSMRPIQFTLGFVGFIGLEIAYTNNYLNKFYSKMEKACNQSK